MPRDAVSRPAIKIERAQLLHLEQPRRSQGGSNQDTRPGGGVVETKRIEDGDLHDAPDGLNRGQAAPTG